MDEFPHDIIEEEHIWITVSDGTRLAGHIWRPSASDSDPVPGILEFLPYRQRDLTSERDSVNHPYLAGHGYACVRVDLRGAGNSEGCLIDEYLEQEQQDAEDVLAWIASQRWCSGRTGMMGISWGGFNALQVAARRPASLGAIAISSFTVDRFGDDMHYMGGCLLSDNFAEASTMFGAAGLPPDPAIVGENWRDMWFDRLEAISPWIDTWLSHQQRDDYWKHASVNEDYSAVHCPVIASSGWADGYSNSVFRVMENLDVPKKGIIGPWAHKYPHMGVPGPAIGYLQILVDWWDRWLKGVENSVMDGPTLRVWMQDSAPPSSSYEERQGRWVGLDEWPSRQTTFTDAALADHAIDLAPTGIVGAEPGELTIKSPLTVGQFAGKWASYGTPPDLPSDQREEDAGSLIFDTPELAETCEILGAPVVSLELSADEPVAMIAVRLLDVAPDGSSTRVTYGLLNLTHRDSDEDPEPLEPGEHYRVRIPLNGVAQSFPAGHRIRMAVSTSYWPLAWPAPAGATVTVYPPNCVLSLPLWDARATDSRPSPYLPSEGARRLATARIVEPDAGWVVCRDLATGNSTVEIVKDSGTVAFEKIGLEFSRRVEERYGRHGDEPTSVYGETLWNTEFRRGGWRVGVESAARLTCTATDFVLEARIDGFEGRETVYSRDWQKTIPRRLV
ncbi:hypothetical protein BJY26_001402 [Spelaeicoccus albus]|uniref:Xaa-Pro dipeptidyl-peptidase C-terminal domain-containing protein n=1 Tax=Spelaeicoccus albus TaxID=1280376 RepID=A0A7Z0ABE4_9MICO|nr:hypothetical protein [Spelaeicoccus albus]